MRFSFAFAAKKKRTLTISGFHDSYEDVFESLLSVVRDGDESRLNRAIRNAVKMHTKAGQRILAT